MGSLGDGGQVPEAGRLLPLADMERLSPTCGAYPASRPDSLSLHVGGRGRPRTEPRWGPAETRHSRRVWEESGAQAWGQGGDAGLWRREASGCQGALSTGHRGWVEGTRDPGAQPRAVWPRWQSGPPAAGRGGPCWVLTWFGFGVSVVLDSSGKAPGARGWGVKGSQTVGPEVQCVTSPGSCSPGGGGSTCSHLSPNPQTGPAPADLTRQPLRTWACCGALGQRPFARCTAGP